MAGILGDALQTARQFQGLASVEQQMQQQAKQSEQQKIGFEALKRYQKTAQDGNPDNDAMTTALIYNPDAAKNVLAHVGIQDKRQKQDAASFAIRAASIADDPQAFNSALDSPIALYIARFLRRCLRYALLLKPKPLLIKLKGR